MFLRPSAGRARLPVSPQYSSPPSPARSYPSSSESEVRPAACCQPVTHAGDAQSTHDPPRRTGRRTHDDYHQVRTTVVGGRCHDVLPIPHTPRHSACSAAVVPTGVRSCAAVAAVGAVHVQGGVGRGWCLKHKQESQTTATRLRTQPTSRGPPSAWAAAAQHLSMR